MKKGKTLNELAAELTRQRETAQDYVADTRTMRMTPDTSELHIDGVDMGGADAMAVNDLAHSQIASRTGIPKRYYDKMLTETPALLAGNVNHWFHNDPHRRMVRTLDGHARAFLSDRYRRIDNYPVAETVLEAMSFQKDAGFEVVSADVTDQRLYIQARMPRLEQEVKLNDVVQAGIAIRNSEVGLGAIEIDPLVYRLKCLNGMIVAESVADGRMRRTHVGGKVLAGDGNIIYQDDTMLAMDEALMKQIRDAVRQLSDPALFMRLVEKMKNATEGLQIKQPVQAVEKLTKTLSLPKLEQDGILESLIREQDYSRWGLLNAVTQQANTTESYDRSVELEMVGGQILNMPSSAWKTIAEAA